MGEIIVAMLAGPFMWAPGLNILVGLIAFGWRGALVGVLITVLFGGGAASNKRARRTVRNTASKWWDILNVKPDATEDEIKRAYRNRAKWAHPDHGGSAAAMAELNRARDEALPPKNRFH